MVVPCHALLECLFARSLPARRAKRGLCREAGLYELFESVDRQPSLLQDMGQR